MHWVLKTIFLYRLSNRTLHIYYSFSYDLFHRVLVSSIMAFFSFFTLFPPHPPPLVSCSPYFLSDTADIAHIKHVMAFLKSQWLSLQHLLPRPSKGFTKNSKCPYSATPYNLPAMCSPLPLCFAVYLRVSTPFTLLSQVLIFNVGHRLQFWNTR